MVFGLKSGLTLVISYFLLHICYNSTKFKGVRVWSIEFASEISKKEFLNLPKSLLARGIKLLDLLEIRGNTLGEPYTKSLNDGLFEIRIKAEA